MTPTNPTPVLDKDPVAWAKHTLAIEQRKHAKCRQELHAASRRIAALEEALRACAETAGDCCDALDCLDDAHSQAMTDIIDKLARAYQAGLRALGAEGGGK